MDLLTASEPLGPSPLVPTPVLLHPTLTAETHNFPSGVAPYPGAATGAGGRIRDNQAVGRGGLVCAGGAGYCTGNLHIPGYPLPWEEDGYSHPPDLASPLDILIGASNGASDYGNCFGEPLIYGFTRTFGLRLPDGYRSWYKPIMYSVGAGQIRDEHTVKGGPEKDMLVVQVGGPAYRIGMGGGAASSMEQGKNVQELDFNAVQRGDPEMEQRVNRVIRACVELGEANPIVSAHDLGAGGDCNALPEIVEPTGAVIDLRAIPVGDQTLSVLEIWGNESQERNALLVLPADLGIMETLAARENVPLAIVGRVTGDRMLVLHDETDDTRPVDLPLDDILGQLPPKTFEFAAPIERSRASGPPPGLGLPPGARPGPPASGHRLQALPHQQGRPRRHRAGHPAATGGPAPPAPVGLRPDRPDLRRPLRDRPQPGRAAHQGTDQPRGGRPDGRGGGAPEHGRRGGLRHQRDQVLGQLDAGREAARRGRLALRCGLRAPGHPDRRSAWPSTGARTASPWRARA